jgi:hypothetical protein
MTEQGLPFAGPPSREGLDLCTSMPDGLWQTKVTNLLDTDIVVSNNYKVGHAKFQDQRIRPSEYGASAVLVE